MPSRKRKRGGNVVNHLVYLIKMIYKNRHCFGVQTRLAELKSACAYRRRRNVNNSKLGRIIDFNRPWHVNRKIEIEQKSAYGSQNNGQLPGQKKSASELKNKQKKSNNELNELWPGYNTNRRLRIRKSSVRRPGRKLH